MNRKIINVLLGLFVAFVYYNTLIPFQFKLPGHFFSDFLGMFNIVQIASNKHNLSLTDIAGNILLFIPFGFLLYLWLRQRGVRWAFVLCILPGALFSFSIEFLQLFIKQRNSSIVDILNNTFGTAVGAGAAVVYFKTIANSTEQFLKKILREQPLVIILLVVLAFQVVAAIIPFNVSITVSDFIKSVKKVHLFPFQNKSFGMVFLNRPGSTDMESFDWFAFVESTLFWMVWGYVLWVCYQYYWKERKNGSLLLWASLIVPPVFLEFIQLFIVSRFSDVNDILAYYLGMASSILLARFTFRKERYSLEEAWKQLGVAVKIYLVFIVFTGLQPFDWLLHPQNLFAKLSIKTFVPFYAYYKKTSIWNIYDLINSLFFFIPISLYYTRLMREKGGEWLQIYPKTILAGFALGAFIEFVQLFSRSRTGEITDAILFGVGGFLGTFLWYYYCEEIRPMLKAGDMSLN